MTTTVKPIPQKKKKNTPSKPTTEELDAAFDNIVFAIEMETGVQLAPHQILRVAKLFHEIIS